MRSIREPRSNFLKPRPKATLQPHGLQLGREAVKIGPLSHSRRSRTAIQPALGSAARQLKSLPLGAAASGVSECHENPPGYGLEFG